MVCLGTITTATPSGGVDTYACTTDGFGVRLMRYGQTVQVILLSATFYAVAVLLLLGMLRIRL